MGRGTSSVGGEISQRNDLDGPRRPARGVFASVLGAEFILRTWAAACSCTMASRLASQRLERAQLRATGLSSSRQKKKDAEIVAEETRIREIYNKAFQEVRENPSFMNIGSARHFAAEDRHFCLVAVTLNGEALKFVPELYRDDDEIVLAAVRKCGKAIVHCSDRLKHDRRVALAAVTDSAALQFCSDEHRADPEVVTAAVQSNSSRFGVQIQFASASLRADRAFMFGLLKKARELVSSWGSTTLHGGALLRYASEELRSDRDFVMLALRNGALRQGFNVLSISSELRGDRELVLSAVELSEDLHCCLEFASDALRADPDFLVACLTQQHVMENPVYKLSSMLNLAAADVWLDKRVRPAALLRRHHSLAPPPTSHQLTCPLAWYPSRSSVRQRSATRPPSSRCSGSPLAWWVELRSNVAGLRSKRASPASLILRKHACPMMILFRKHAYPTSTRPPSRLIALTDS